MYIQKKKKFNHFILLKLWSNNSDASISFSYITLLSIAHYVIIWKVIVFDTVDSWNYSTITGT